RTGWFSGATSSRARRSSASQPVAFSAPADFMDCYNVTHGTRRAAACQSHVAGFAVFAFFCRVVHSKFMAGSLTRNTVQGPPPPPEVGGGGWGSGWDGMGASRRTSLVGIFVLIVCSFVLFAAFAVAFLMRRSIAEDWSTTPKPPVLLVNTAVLLASSVVL